MGPRLKVLLIVSLILNVFLIGAAAGILAVRGRLAHFVGPAGQSAGGAPMLRGIRALDPNDRRAFRSALHGQMGDIRPLMRDAAEARRQAEAELTRPQFDKAATLAAMARARDAETRSRARIEETLVDFAATLNLQQRQALAEGMRQRARGGRGGPPGRLPPPPPQGDEGPPDRP